MVPWTTCKTDVCQALFGKANYDEHTPIWASLSARAVIPQHLRSRDAHGGRKRVVGLGIVKGATALLTRLIDLGVSSDRWTATIDSASVAGKWHIIGGGAGGWYVEESTSYLTAAAAIVHALTLGAQDDDCSEVIGRWNGWLAAIRTALGGQTPPYIGAQLQQAAADTASTEGIMALVDAVYAALLRLEPSLAATTDPLPVAGRSMSTVHHTIYGQPIPPVQTGTAPDTTLHATLRRVIRRGGTALLIGPTGAGKTTAALAAAAAEGAVLVGPIKGMPGLEDRMLYGGPQYVNGHYAFVPGPLAESFLRAQAEQRTVLIIDELARMDPYHVAAIIGALDRADGRLLRHAHGLGDEQRAQLRDDIQYYVLHLPTGERLLAPVTHLSVIATSNLGDEYAQIQHSFDPALLRRFDVLLDVERATPDERSTVLQARGLPHSVARLAVELETFSTLHTAAVGGLLQRELNLGTLISWTQAAADLVAEGAAWAEALTLAAEMTIIPYSCPRLSDGRLEVPSARILRDEINRLTRSLRGLGIQP